jgi:hypothetical protein
MTEPTPFHREIRAVLDESAGRLPYRIAHRLESARAAALARHQPVARSEAVSVALSLASAGSGDARPQAPLWWRVGITALPLLVLVVGLYAIVVWNDTETSDEIAEIDTAVLTDEVPLSAYTDRGFGVFLKNIRQD